jgi:hypothetical protein
MTGAWRKRNKERHVRCYLNVIMFINENMMVRPCSLHESI